MNKHPRDMPADVHELEDRLKRLCRENLADFLREEFPDDDYNVVRMRSSEDEDFRQRVFRQLLGSLLVLRDDLIAWTEGASN